MSNEAIDKNNLQAVKANDNDYSHILKVDTFLQEVYKNERDTTKKIKLKAALKIYSEVVQSLFPCGK